MKILNSSKGVGGILGGFRGLVGDSKKITFIGTPGFCTPFAELMGFVLRGSGKELTFISNLNFNAAKTMIYTLLSFRFTAIVTFRDPSESV